MLIISDRVEDLTPATSALLGLMFPLRWPHTVIPVLPASLVHYLDAPVPFLMGMHQRGLQGVSADLSSITIINLVGLLAGCLKLLVLVPVAVSCRSCLACGGLMYHFLWRHAKGCRTARAHGHISVALGDAQSRSRRQNRPFLDQAANDAFVSFVPAHTPRQYPLGLIL